MDRLNIGCGMTPIGGWRNFDNSLSIRIAKWGTFGNFLYKFGLINSSSLSLIHFCQSNNIEWANASHHIPVASQSISVIYTSHMLEHLDRNEAISFLFEAKRVIASGGIIRIAVPDLKIKINDYIKSNDADFFIESLYVCIPRPKTIAQKIRFLFVGTRHHQWMYDGDSLVSLLLSAGFESPVVLMAGDSLIKDYGLLDLEERSDESVYVEAMRP